MGFPGTVAVLATDRQFLEWRNAKKTVPFCNRLWPAAVTHNAARENGTTEAIIGEFVSW
jgi:hypothetical protein